MVDSDQQENRKPIIPAFYLDKNNVEIKTIMMAYHYETDEPMVVYKSIKSEKVYVIPASVFVEEEKFGKKKINSYNFIPGR